LAGGCVMGIGGGGRGGRLDEKVRGGKREDEGDLGGKREERGGVIVLSVECGRVERRGETKTKKTVRNERKRKSSQGGCVCVCV